MTTENLPDKSQSAETLKRIKQLVDHVYKLKLEADRADKEYNKAKSELAEIMEQAEVEKMQGDTCNASLALKTSVTVPKDDADKKVLFDYIEKEHGKDVLFRMLTINARTFSSWHQKEIESKIEEGELEFEVPAVKPYEYYSVGLRKRAVK